MFSKYRSAYLLIAFLLIFVETASAQSELAPWGNLTGIRRHGQLFEFETNLTVQSKNGFHWASTGKERQRPYYSRNGKTQTVSTNIDSLFFKETVSDRLFGKIKLVIQMNVHADTTLKGVFMCINLPGAAYADGKLQLVKAYADSLSPAHPVTLTAKAIIFTSAHRRLTISFDEEMPFSIKKDTANGNNTTRIYLTLAQGTFHKGDSLRKSFTMKVSGDIDRSPVNIAVDTSKQGRPFAGLGGNFRLQNPKTDPQVIDYSLNNLRVAFGRVEMPWRFWQPREGRDSLDTIKVHPAVVKAMEMAQRLGKMNIPFILSAWSAPKWAIVGKPNFRPVNGIWGNPLNPDKMTDIYQSITAYILYLKAHYGVEPALFSFNESDLGINIRITAQEHDDLIKGLGAYFAAHGVRTKMLLGDNSDATTYKFIYPALNAAAARPYIGAISFHSWRGWDADLLQKWADAAKQINVPLIVGEGSIDAQAWGYPQVFQEPTYALQEINLYTRLLNICQPLSILQWQLTADYSPLIGGGIFGNDEPLHPGQRFWNLKQLASTPANLFALPITCSNPAISCAALGDNYKGIYTINLVNNGTKRKIILTGLPANLQIRAVYETNKTSAMKAKHTVKVENGQITFKADATSYYTLTGTVSK